MTKELIAVTITLLITIVVNFIGLFMGKEEKWFYYFVFPLLFIMLFYLLIASQLRKLGKNISNNIQMLSPDIKFIKDSKEKFEKEMVESIQKAKKFVFTTGGRARESKYLQSISKKVITENVQYYRVILGDHIRHVLCQHLCNLLNKKLDNIHIGHLAEETYGNFTATDEEVVMALPSTKIDMVDTGLIIMNKAVAEDYRMHILNIYGDSKKLKKEEEIKELCIDCRDKVKTI